MIRDKKVAEAAIKSVQNRRYYLKKKADERAKAVFSPMPKTEARIKAEPIDEEDRLKSFEDDEAEDMIMAERTDEDNGLAMNYGSDGPVNENKAEVEVHEVEMQVAFEEDD